MQWSWYSINVFPVCRTLLSLPFIPAEHIQPMFTTLQRKAPNDERIHNILEYVNTTWIRSSIWPPHHWSCFQETVRTNNDVEGWHRRINERARRGQLPFYVLVPLLHNEAVMVRLQARLVSEHKLKRYRRKTYTRLQGKLSELWDAYGIGQLSPYQLLRECSQICSYGITDTK